MLRIALVNMPFASWARPSFAISQMSPYLKREFGDEVSVEIVNLSFAFAEYFTPTMYEMISEEVEHLNTGLGDWIFRQVAFPETEDNAAEYFQRFYPGSRWADLREVIGKARAGLGEELEDQVERHDLAGYDIVGFTSMFAQHVPSIAAARAVKRRRPGTLVVIGGANCETPMGNVVAEMIPEFDYVFSGPALLSFGAFVRCVLDGRLERADEIAGVLSRRNLRRAGTLASIGRDNDINDYVRPDYDQYFRDLARYPALAEGGSDKLALFFETSRGCWWGERSHCTFCGLNGQSMGYRTMAADIALQQFTDLFETASWCKTYYCTDNVMPRNYPKDVFSQLKTPDGARIFYEIKLPVSRSDLAQMVKAGVSLVQPGIEALSTSTLKLMAKGTTSFQNIQFLKNCRELGVEPVWNLLIGFPREESYVYEKYSRDIPLLTHLPPPQGVYVIRFDRFSPYFTERLEYGLDLQPMDYYPLIYPFDARQLDEMAYFFTDHSLGSYALDAYEWHPRLRGLVDAWLSGWSERDLRLVNQGDGWSLCDSRAGEPVYHPVSDAAVRLLRQLESPVTAERLARDWPGGRGDVGVHLDHLRGLGAIFEEDGKVLSVVLPDRDPADV